MAEAVKAKDEMKSCLIFEGANFKKSAFMKNREGHTKDTGSKA
jgi:hypothetical protein